MRPAPAAARATLRAPARNDCSIPAGVRTACPRRMNVEGAACARGQQDGDGVVRGTRLRMDGLRAACHTEACRKGEIRAIALSGGRTCLRAARTSSDDGVAPTKRHQHQTATASGKRQGRVEGGRRMSPLEEFEGRRAIEEERRLSFSSTHKTRGSKERPPNRKRGQGGAALEVNGDGCSSGKADGTQDDRGKDYALKASGKQKGDKETLCLGPDLNDDVVFDDLPEDPISDDEAEEPTVIDMRARQIHGLGTAMQRVNLPALFAWIVGGSIQLPQNIGLEAVLGPYGIQSSSVEAKHRAVAALSALWLKTRGESLGIVETYSSDPLTLKVDDSVIYCYGYLNFERGEDKQRGSKFWQNNARHLDIENAHEGGEGKKQDPDQESNTATSLFFPLHDNDQTLLAWATGTQFSPSPPNAYSNDPSRTTRFQVYGVPTSYAATLSSTHAEPPQLNALRLDHPLPTAVLARPRYSSRHFPLFRTLALPPFRAPSHAIGPLPSNK
ncbi:hypothetical protein B0H13DRAFT_1872664 [Mycena leptocephala]|nr:hypothetical protein B0H13DRAFT_1872664 [Mycena leptocephala]